MQQHDESTHGQSAATALFDRYASGIFAYERLYIPSWEDAEDVALEVFTAALEQEHFSALSERKHLSWLRRVAHHKLVDRYRRSMHFSTFPLEQVREAVRTEEALAPEQLVLRREELERLYRAVRSWPLFQQQLWHTSRHFFIPCHGERNCHRHLRDARWRDDLEEYHTPSHSLLSRWILWISSMDG